MAGSAPPKVAQIPWTHDLVTIDAGKNVLEAFAQLVEKKILSAPVYDAAAGKYLGFFDVRDMLVFVLKIIHESGKADSKIPVQFADLSHLMREVEALHPTAVGGVVNLSRNDLFCPVTDDTSILDVVKLLGDKGIHRVPVMDKDGKVGKIISQTALCKFLLEHSVLVGILGEKTIGDAGIGIKPVVTLSTDAPVVEAFEVMNEKSISGVGLVDEKGHLVTSISTTDLRTIVAGERFGFVGISCMDFVVRSRALDGPQEKPAVVTVSTTTSLHTVMERMARTKLHRLYIVDDHHMPVGIVTLKDILQYALRITTD